MEEKVELIVNVAYQHQVDELLHDPKVYGDAIRFLINELRTRLGDDTLTWRGDDFDVVFKNGAHEE